MLDPQVDLREAARLRGEGPEEERMILRLKGGTYWRTNSRSVDV
jgi:hypothetical protein